MISYFRRTQRHARYYIYIPSQFLNAYDAHSFSCRRYILLLTLMLPLMTIYFLFSSLSYSHSIWPRTCSKYAANNTTYKSFTVGRIEYFTFCAMLFWNMIRRRYIVRKWLYATNFVKFMLQENAFISRWYQICTRYYFTTRLYALLAGAFRRAADAFTLSIFFFHCAPCRLCFHTGLTPHTLARWWAGPSRQMIHIIDGFLSDSASRFHDAGSAMTP